MYSFTSLSTFISCTNVLEEDINNTKKKNTKCVLFSGKEVGPELNAEKEMVSAT
jgi:hypothetical protein